jgi:hypothetical protein
MLSRPAGRLVDAPIQEAIEGAFRERDLPSRADLDAVYRALRQKDSLIQELSDKMRALEEKLALMTLEQAEAMRDLTASLDGLGGRLEALERDEEPCTSHTEETAPILLRFEVEAPQEVEADPPVAEATPTTCSVPGCTLPYRSRGFCSPHYQRWRRGTLEGFVPLTGLVGDGDHMLQIDKNLAGRPYTLGGGNVVFVRGKRVVGVPV